MEIGYDKLRITCQTLFVVCSPIIIVTSIPTQTWIALESLTTFSALISLAMLVYGFDFLFHIDKVLFFFNTIIRILSEIKDFLLVMVLFLLMFGVPMSILDMNRSEEEKTIADNFPHWLPNLLINQYLLALGQLDDSRYAHASDAWILYCFFFCATIVIFIVMTNQLITIVGNIHDECEEQELLDYMQVHVSCMVDYYFVNKHYVGKEESEKDYKCFLYLVTPEENDEDVKETLVQNGVVAQVKNHTDKHFSKLEA